MLIPKQEIIRSEALKQFIRSLPCVWFQCNGESQHAHLRKYAQAGGARKPSDIYANPLCYVHHELQGRIGETKFWLQVFERDEHFMFECLRARCEKVYQEFLNP